MNRLFVFPTLTEAAPLIEQAGFTPDERPDLYHLQGSEWKLMICGIGTVPVIYNLTRHFAANRYDQVVHAGIAGSYFLPLQPGDVVQVTRDTFADIGIDHGGIFRWVFHEALWDPNQKPFQNGWLITPEEPSLHLECVSSITVDKVTGSPERKAHMISHFNPQAESMEGAAVVYVCMRESIPVLQIRAISNYTGGRDRYNWKTEEAIAALTQTLKRLL